MLINPKTAIENGWVKGIKSEKQIQPNAIDFTLDRMFYINHEAHFIIGEDPETPGKEKKRMRGGEEMATYNDQDGRPMFHLSQWRHNEKDPRSYDILSDVYVELPEGVAAMTIVRSSLCRNGIFLTSGLYDSGFKGHVGCVLHNMMGEAQIQKGTRVGQIFFVEAASSGLYTGGWNHEVGTAAPHQ